MLAASTANGQDVVHLKADDSGAGSTKQSGEILDYTGRELRLRLSTGKERTIPAERVASISTKYSPEQIAADALFAKRDFAGALEQYRAALGREKDSREWVRRQILAQIVWCQRSLGQTQQAVSTFLTLIERDPTTQYFDCIPLAWLPAQAPAGFEKKARAWLARDQSAAAQLIGASYLLATDRALAVERLQRLANDSDSRIARLAEAQLWRANSFNVPDGELGRRMRGIGNIPAPLRAGPYFSVGSVMAMRRPEDAALVLLRVPILYSRERALSAAALLLAGDCLEKAGQADEAATLYKELVTDHQGAPEAVDASARLRQ